MGTLHSVTQGAKVTLFVVAISQKEADDIADMCGHDTRTEAETHLAEVKAPPTDPYYAAMYRIYKCVLPMRGSVNDGSVQ